MTIINHARSLQTSEGNPEVESVVRTRREFIWAAGVASVAIGAGAAIGRSARAGAESSSFQLKYAPHFGMFRHSAGEDLLDQLRFAADEGFTAWEDNGMTGRPRDVQQQIADTMSQLDMQMGVIVGSRGIPGGASFTSGDRDVADKVVEVIRDSVEVAKRVHCKWMTIVPGNLDPKLPMDYQTANCVEVFKRCCDVLEPHGLTMVIEPLNHRTDHPGVFLTGSPQAYQICRAVDSPSLKILFDIYHQQITEGNLLPNIDRCWEEIGYFQCGDNPGRKEPGTGEINYRNVFRHLHAKAYDGIMGMEHGNSQPGVEGERAVIAAYRDADAF